MCPIAGDAHFDHLTEAAPARLLHCKATLFISRRSEYFMDRYFKTILLKFSSCPITSDGTHGFFFYLLSYKVTISILTLKFPPHLDSESSF